MKRELLLGVCGVCVLLVSASRAGEIGFLEDFALSENREEALGQLIPGTRDDYYYRCLHYQNTGRLDEVDRLLKLWIERYNRTGRVEEIENRQALLRYPQSSRETREFLRQRLNLNFDHQRERLGEKPQLPTQLDPDLISRETLTRRALERHSGTMEGFEDRALEWAIGLELNPDRRRHLLSRLERPDLPNIARHVVADLNEKRSGGFGSLSIHGKLLLPQLEECLALKGDLLNETNFVNVYLSKLWPSPDVDWQHDDEAREAYLRRLWAFAARLAPVHNSLKAHVLYHWLAHDRARGVYDRNRFMTYIRLPKNTVYVSREYMRESEHRRYAANLGADYRGQTLLPPVGSDEPLVRSYFEHFLLNEDSYTPYIEYVEDGYLKRRFAETKILAGIGDMERWYSMLPPAEYQALKDRIDLDFAYTNKTAFDLDEQIALDLAVKNVPTLIVKVFEVNALNFYRAHGSEVDTAIDLDGLVANFETTYTYSEPPLRRVMRHFEFPGLEGRGTCVIEFIGNGMSSRALVRRGKLRFLVRSSTAGHIFTVLDEANRKLRDAGLWLGGHEYRTDKDGVIAVPYSAQPGRHPIILTHDGFASLDFFEHQSERYELTAGIHVDRESLITRKKASVIVRPSLAVNGTPVTLSVLEDVTLVITSTDQEGISTTKEIKDFALHEDRESIYEFQVPANLLQLSFELRARVRNLSQATKQDLSVHKSLSVNGIDRTVSMETLFLSRIDGQYALDVLGKTGEIRPDHPVRIELKHRDFRGPVSVTLQTDADGRIHLGPLEGIEHIEAGIDGHKLDTYLAGDWHSPSGNLHGAAGETLQLPYMGAAERPLRSELSLLETLGSTFVSDRFEALSIAGGFLQLRGLPAGDYDLYLKAPERHVTVRVTAGEAAEGYVLSPYRQLQVVDPRPLQISAVERAGDAIRVKLENASKFTRVHVAATRYWPEQSIYGDLGAVSHLEPEMMIVPRPETLYVVGRDIGDEYRYILERKYAKKYPGNMLARPSLLLNPWAIRSTETGLQQARAGGVFDRQSSRGASAAIRPRSLEEATALDETGFANLDFLGQPSVVLTNLRPGEDGVITIPRADLGSGQHLHIIAISPQDTVYRQLSLPEVEPQFADLRLATGLDPERHYTERNETSVVKKDARFVLGDITTSDFEVYDTLAKVHALFATISGDATLVEFGFILEWPKLTPDQKREKYSKYASHELNFFLFKKDPEFFETVIRPYLANKHDKTFLDHWLLGEDLAAYLRPWAYGQLNIVERILLAQSIEGERTQAMRHVEDLLDLVPPDNERLAQLFKTALRGRALETGDSFGVEAAAETAAAGAAEPMSRLARRKRSEAKKDAAAPSLALEALGLEKAEKNAADKSKALKEQLAESEAEELEAEAAPEADFFADDLRSQEVRQLYRKLDATKEWVENNYYHLPIESQNASLITVSPFWLDYARHDGQEPFFSTHFTEAARNFAEMMFALSVLDLPFEAGEHKSSIVSTRFTLDAASPLVVFHKEIKEATPSDRSAPILVSQNFYRHGDRYQMVGSERLDKYITDEFLVHTPYGCHVVVTNPTSSMQKLEVLLQIPRGAISVLDGQPTRSIQVVLEPYRTWTHDYFFYFPAPGDFPHYPVHVARNEQLIGFARAASLHVVETPSQVDRDSWDYISQRGTESQVLDFLEKYNLGRVDLGRIAWRMRDADFFQSVLALLERRHVYHHTLWSYGIRHDAPRAIREFLRHSDSFVARCGRAIESDLLTIDPVERKSYQLMEYWPLVNARAHRLGKSRQILNDRFSAQYMRLLDVLSFRAALDDQDLMSVTCALLLQDRVEEALRFFQRVRPGRLPDQLQYDYCDAYLGFHTENLRRTRELAAKYSDYPVDRWRLLFGNVASQLAEIEGTPSAGGVKPSDVVDEDDRTQRQTRLAATEPDFDFGVESRKVTLTYQNLERVQVNYYLMDIELLFSRNPFVDRYSDQFAYIRPNLTTSVELDGSGTRTFELPERFHSSNVLIEILGGGQKKTQTYFSSTLQLQLVGNYAQLSVREEESGKPLSKTYVKVFARMRDGRVRFYKDGYTDLRGRFDYGSLSTGEIDQVRKFSILVMSDAHGATVREADPPQL